MTPQNHPEVIDPLAAEYVLGTLRGPARRRFESWRVNVPAVQERCRFWEDQLYQLYRGIRPIKPPPHVWEAIRMRLNLPATRFQRRTGRALAIAASVLLVAGLSVLLYERATSPGKLSESASITAPAGTPVWQVEFYGSTGRLILRAGQLPSRAADRDFELWALPAGGKPVSLGVLPVAGTSQRTLSSAQLQAMAQSQQIAVTVEQVGGSPNRQPTTTPIFVAPLRTAT